MHLDPHRKSAQYQFFFFVLRRCLLVVFAIVLYDHPFWQLNCYIWLSWLQLLYLCVARPFETTKLNVQEILNEAVVLLVGYFAQA